MLEMIRRIFKIAGRSRQKIIVGILVHSLAIAGKVNGWHFNFFF